MGNGANFFPYVFRTQPISWIDLPENRLGNGEYLTDRLNMEAVEFIERNQGKPFFLYLSHYAPHTILNGRPDLVDKYRMKHKPVEHLGELLPLQRQWAPGRFVRTLGKAPQPPFGCHAGEH